MEKKTICKLYKIIISLFFILYMLFLIKLTIIRYPMHTMADIMQNTNWDTKLKMANFIPFHTILLYLKAYFAHRINTNIVIVNLIGNAVILIPFGFCVPLLFKRFQKIYMVLLLAFLTVLCIELTQFFTGFGEFDVDDILLNTFSAVIGYYVYKISAVLYHKIDHPTN